MSAKIKIAMKKDTHELNWFRGKNGNLKKKKNNFSQLAFISRSCNHDICMNR